MFVGLLLLLLLSCFSHVRLCDDSPPGFPVPGILKARTLEWVAISFSNAWQRKVKVKSLSHVWLLVTPWTVAHQAPPSVGFSGWEYWSGVPLIYWVLKGHILLTSSLYFLQSWIFSLVWNLKLWTKYLFEYSKGQANWNYFHQIGCPIYCLLIWQNLMTVLSSV